MSDSISLASLSIKNGRTRFTRIGYSDFIWSSFATDIPIAPSLEITLQRKTIVISEKFEFFNNYRRREQLLFQHGLSENIIKLSIFFFYVFYAE